MDRQCSDPLLGRCLDSWMPRQVRAIPFLLCFGQGGRRASWPGLFPSCCYHCVDFIWLLYSTDFITAVFISFEERAFHLLEAGWDLFYI